MRLCGWTCRPGYRWACGVYGVGGGGGGFVESFTGLGCEVVDADETWEKED
jgi:hypothetical protein